MADRLFIYGTLHPDRAPAAIRAAARQLQPLGQATVWGTLYQLGSYPGVLLPGPAPHAVPGEIFLVPDQSVLAQLDAYEDFRADDPRGSLFLRVEANVTLPNGTRERCWVYTYNGPVSEALSLPPDKS